jgi:hypothetical protein
MSEVPLPLTTAARADSVRGVPRVPARPRPPMTVAQRTRPGHYTVLAPLGAGGMGEVWLALGGRL